MLMIMENNSKILTKLNIQRATKYYFMFMAMGLALLIKLIPSFNWLLGCSLLVCREYCR